MRRPATSCESNLTARFILEQLPRDTLWGKERTWQFFTENGDVLLVTQYGVHLWGFGPDKNVVQLLVWMLLQQYRPLCTMSVRGRERGQSCHFAE